MPGASAVGAIRTPGGRRDGKLAPVHPVDLAAAMFDGLISRSKGH